MQFLTTRDFPRDLVNGARSYVAARHRTQEGLTVALRQKTLIRKDQDARVVRTADQAPRGLLRLNTAAGKTYLRQAASSLCRALARQRISGLRERELGNDHAFKRGSRSVEALPKNSSAKKRQMLVGEEVVAEPLHRNAPFLADEPQVVSLQNRLNLIEALLHLTPVREQRQHGSMLSEVGFYQQLLQALEILGLLRLGHVLHHVYGHVPIEVVRGLQGERRAMGRLRLIQAERSLERREGIGDGQRRRCEHDGIGLLEESFVHQRGNAVGKGFDHIAALFDTPAQMGGVDVLVSTENNMTSHALTSSFNSSATTAISLWTTAAPSTSSSWETRS